MISYRYFWILIPFISILILFSGCSNVYADSFESLYENLDFDSLESRPASESSDIVEYYYSFRSFSLDDPDSFEYFYDYPYWFFVNDKVYYSYKSFSYTRTPDGSYYDIYVYSDNVNFNETFYSSNFGIYTTGEVVVVRLNSSDFSRVRSNSDIIYSGSDSLPNVNSIPDDYEPEFPSTDIGEGSVGFNYYTFASSNSGDARLRVLFSDNGVGYLDGYRSSNSFPSNISYSYFDVLVFGSKSSLPFGYITDDSLWDQYTGSNYDVSYEGYDGDLGNLATKNFPPGVLSLKNPVGMPDGWEPFDESFIYRPGDIINPDPDPDPDGSWIGDILSWLNPFGDNFFLKVAFVPSDDFFPDLIQSTVGSNSGILDNFDDVINSLKVIFDTKFGNEDFAGIDYGDRVLRAIPYTYKLHPGHDPDSIYDHCGDSSITQPWHDCTGYRMIVPLKDLKLLDASYIQIFISKFKYWVGSVMQFFFMLWLVRWVLTFFGANAPWGGYSVGEDPKSKK